jgi:tetratricopeptide (TPR) repeat protein
MLMAVLGLNVATILDNGPATAQARSRAPLSSKPVVVFPSVIPGLAAQSPSRVPAPPGHVDAPLPVEAQNPTRISPEPNVPLRDEAFAFPAIPINSNIYGPPLPAETTENKLDTKDDISERIPSIFPQAQQRIYDKAANSAEAQAPCPVPVVPAKISGIKAVTTNNRGETIYLQPRQGALPDFSSHIVRGNPINDNADNGNDGDGYNALFQEEVGFRQRVDSLVFAAQQAYRRKEYNKALEALQNATRLDNNNSDLIAAIGEVQLEMRRHDEAVKAYQKADQITPQRHRLRYAQVLALSGQREDAIKLLKSPLSEPKQEAQRAYLLGTLYEELGELQQALPYLTEAARLQPESADIRYNLGLTYELSGQKTKAHQYYRQAQILDPNAADIKQAIDRTKR